MKKNILSFLAVLIILITIFNCQTPSSSGGGGGGGKGNSGNDDNTTLPIDYSTMISITGGTFIQTDGTDSFGHTISNFQIGKYEVTYDLWYEIYIWAITNGYNFENTGIEGNDGIIGATPTPGNHKPVTMISWRDAIVWCNAYSEKNGLNPCYYYLLPTAIIKDSANATACDGASCSWSANGYRLPTEGEWQFTASNKGTTPYNYASGDNTPYNTSSAIGNYAWYINNSGGITHNVGTREPNQLGIYDMSGNILEWSWDWHGVYPTSAQIDYRGASSGSSREIRGGNWSSDTYAIQVGYRFSIYPVSMSSSVGFRVAISN
jgi:formylglycine-generating enzyme required for sulfatase activity